MSLISQGTNSTFKSTSLEGFILELCQFVQIQESDTAKNPNNQDNFTGRFEQNTGFYNCDFTIPVSQSLTQTGTVEYLATEYLSGVSFTIGSGGTFQSTTICKLLFEVLMSAQIKENSSVNNPTTKNYITGRIDTDKLRFTGNINLPVTLSISDEGYPCFVASEYLV